jgi:hypothetical protein
VSDVNFQQRRERLPLWVPLGMLVVVFSCSFFAYLTLVAPAPARVEKRVAERMEPVKPPKPAPADVSNDEIMKMMALARERFRPAEVEPQVAAETPTSAQPPVRAPTRRIAKPAVSPSISQDAARATTPAPRGSTSEQSAALEVSSLPIARTGQQDPTLAAASVKEPPIVLPLQKELPPPVPSVQTDTSTTLRAVRNEPSARQQPLKTTNSWQNQMRAELDGCGKPGMWRNDVCRETVRWKYCHPNRWDSARDCVVERFASSAVPN